MSNKTDLSSYWEALQYNTTRGKKNIPCDQCRYQLRESPQEVPICIRNRAERVSADSVFPHHMMMMWYKGKDGLPTDKPMCFSSRV